MCARLPGVASLSFAINRPRAAAQAIGQQLIIIDVSSDRDIETAFATFVQRGAVRCSSVPARSYSPIGNNSSRWRLAMRCRPAISCAVRPEPELLKWNRRLVRVGLILMAAHTRAREGARRDRALCRSGSRRLSRSRAHGGERGVVNTGRSDHGHIAADEVID
jgi:hypothetical protein